MTHKALTGIAVKMIKAELTPKPIRVVRGTNAYIRQPQKMVTPVAVAGHFMPRHLRAIFDIFTSVIPR